MMNHTSGNRSGLGLLGVAAICISMSMAVSAGAARAQDGGTLTKLKVLAPPVAYQSLYIGVNEGIFEKHGLEVEITMGVTASEAIPLVLSDQYQIAATSLLPLAQAVQQGVPIKAIASATNALTDVEDMGGLLVPPGSEIASPANLAGKTIAVNGLNTQMQLAILESATAAGVEPSRLSFVNVPFNSMAQVALSGNVDAIYSLDLFRHNAISEGFTEIEQSIRVHFPNISWAVMIATDTFIEQQPEVAKRFIAAIGEASAFANENPDTIRAVDLEMTRLPPEYAKTRNLYKLGGPIDLAVTQKMLDAAKRHEILDEVPALDAMISGLAPVQ